MENEQTKKRGGTILVPEQDRYHALGDISNRGGTILVPEQERYHALRDISQ